METRKHAPLAALAVALMLALSPLGALAEKCFGKGTRRRTALVYLQRKLGRA